MMLPFIVLAILFLFLAFAGCSAIPPEQAAQAEKEARAAVDLARAAYCLAPPNNGSDTAIRAWTVVCAHAATKPAP